MRSKDRRWHLRVALAFVALGLTIYLIGVPRTPPGFCLDESSIAYNAQLIATTGHDEYHEAWPLFFRAFGEYKNPIYIYLLALLFKLTGPSVAVARTFSAILGVIGALLIAYLAAAISQRKEVGIVVGLSAMLTPWLYENSRLVFEVALYPALVALFLIAVWRAASRERWASIDVASIASALALLTYAYSIGRLLGPLLALGLIVFASRRHYLEILFTWLGYALTLIPVLVFNRRHPGALTGRFELLSYIHPSTSTFEIMRQFITHYARDVDPVRLLLAGEDNVRDHLAGTGSILLVTFVLAAAGFFLILRRQRNDRWWWFVIYALAVSIIPAALTTTIFPQIRLIALPVLINVLSIPAWTFVFDKARAGQKSTRVGAAVLTALLLLICAQGAYFQVLYHQQAPQRGYICDEKFPSKVLAVALASLRAPIYLFDPPGKSGYVQSYWHGLLGGIDPSRFVRLPNDSSVPAGSVVISTAETCANCRLLAKHLNFIVYTPLPSNLQTRLGSLPEEGFRAEIKPANSVPGFKPGAQEKVTVMVKNTSAVSWPSVGADDDLYLMTVRSRWTTSKGLIVSTSDQASRIYWGLDPGDVVGITVEVVAPNSPGNYQLVIDVVQEGVSWFSDKGSKPLVLNVSVTP